MTDLLLLLTIILHEAQEMSKPETVSTCGSEVWVRGTFWFLKIWHLTNYVNIEIFRCCLFFQGFLACNFFDISELKHWQCCNFWLQMRKTQHFHTCYKMSKKSFFCQDLLLSVWIWILGFFYCCTFFKVFGLQFFLIFQNEQNWTEHKIMPFLLHIL